MYKIFNSIKLKQKRRELRQQPISCEKILWQKLRNNRLNNLKFRRQYSIGKCIVDFYCSKSKLVIEIVGATHSKEVEIKYDAVRQKYIESLGVPLVRYTNTDIKENLNEVLSDILEKCHRSQTHLTPAPLLREERGEQ